VTWLALPVLVSRASVFLITYDCSIAAILSRNGCKVLSPQLSKISKMVSKSVKQVFDFLRLARSWLRIVAAPGVNFSESLAAETKFCFSGREFQLNFLEIGAPCRKLRSQFLHFLPKKFFFAFGVT
jgi:hypothetical protein